MIIDPVGAFDRIKENFILYIKTAFGTRFPSLEEERERLLSKPGVVAQDIWVEPLLKYKSSDKTIEMLSDVDLPGLDKDAIAAFKKLAQSGLFSKERPVPLYAHQVEMLKKVLSGRNCVITSGTGSGKTEAFLLPLFAQLANEMINWERPGSKHANWGDWWHNELWTKKCDEEKKSPRVSQRSNETRPSALRAIILYPMNALVEDQLTRLRTALDSDEARQNIEALSNGNLIYLGRYNGSTPVAGYEYIHTKSGKLRPNRGKLKELADTMSDIEKASKQAEGTESRYFFPRVDGAEMRCRWDMQNNPPDILITNTSMLSVMLMRESDSEIFEKTRKWLAAEDVPQKQHYLIVFHLGQISLTPA